MSTKKMTKRVAVFHNAKHDFSCVMENHTDDENWALDEYVRISGWEVIEFAALPPEARAAAEMASLAALRAETVEEFTEKLNYIDGRIANLRALTGPEAS